MTAAEMLDSLNAVYTQIRADQKKEEYDDILIAAEGDPPGSVPQEEYIWPLMKKRLSS